MKRQQAAERKTGVIKQDTRAKTCEGTPSSLPSRSLTLRRIRLAHYWLMIFKRGPSKLVFPSCFLPVYFPPSGPFWTPVDSALLFQVGSLKQPCCTTPRPTDLQHTCLPQRGLLHSTPVQVRARDTPKVSLAPRAKEMRQCWTNRPAKVESSTDKVDLCVAFFGRYGRISIRINK